MASFLRRVLSAASLFEFAAQNASLFAVVRPFLHLGFDALVTQIANALLKFPSHVISHRCSPFSRASEPFAACVTDLPFAEEESEKGGVI
jgi:hypothetical protein